MVCQEAVALWSECVCPPKFIGCNANPDAMMFGGGAVGYDYVTRVEPSATGSAPLEGQEES